MLSHFLTRTAMADFRARIDNYARAYEPLSEEAESFVKVIDTGRQVLVNRIFGYLPTRIVFYLMNLRINKSPIFLTRHGESEYNVVCMIEVYQRQSCVTAPA